MAIVLVAAAAIAYFALNYVRDRSVERRLTGTWTSDYVREDGMVDPFVWEFLPDGTMRHHPKGQPYAETGSIDDYMWWHVSDGMLVLTFDRQFRQDASLRSKAKVASKCMSGGVCQNLCVRQELQKFESQSQEFFDVRSSKRIAKWFKTSFHFGIGIVHFLDAS